MKITFSWKYSYKQSKFIMFESLDYLLALETNKLVKQAGKSAIEYPYL